LSLRKDKGHLSKEHGALEHAASFANSFTLSFPAFPVCPRTHFKHTCINGCKYHSEVLLTSGTLTAVNMKVTNWHVTLSTVWSTDTLELLKKPAVQPVPVPTALHLKVLALKMEAVDFSKTLVNKSQCIAGDSHLHGVSDWQ
jgi:hypothetical protein